MDRPIAANVDGPARSAAERRLVGFLESVRGSLKRRDLLSRVIALAVCASAGPLLAVVVDHAFTRGLPHWVIAGTGVAFGIGILAAFAYAAIFVQRRAVSYLFAARLIEEGGRVETNSVINAVLLRAMPRRAYAVPAAAQQALHDAEALPPEAVVPPAATRKMAISAGFIALAWLIYILVSPKAVWPSLARFFGADIAAPTATQIELIAPGTRDAIHEAEPLRLIFEFRGRPAGEALLELARGAGPRVFAEKRSLARGSGEFDRRTYELAASEVGAQPLHVRCSAGDGLLERTIVPRPQPRLQDLQVELTPPAYTALPPETTRDPRLSVWAGTRAKFVLRANVPMHDGVFVLNAGTERRTVLTIDAVDPAIASVEVTLLQSGTYRLEFTDETSYACQHPPEYDVLVRGDESPTIEITFPPPEARGGEIDVSRVAELRAAAADDVGLSDVSLVSEERGTLGRFPLLTEHGLRRAEVTAQTASIGLKPGQRVHAWFEALDNRMLPSGEAAPQLTRSEVLTLILPAGAAPARAAGAQKNDGSKPGDSKGDAGGDDAGHEAGASAGHGDAKSDGESGERSPEGAQSNGDNTSNDNSSSMNPGDESGAANPNNSSDPGETGAAREGKSQQPNENAGEPNKSNSQQPDDEKGEAKPDSGSEDSQREKAQRELRKFAREHGKEAGEATKELRRKQGSGDGNSDAGDAKSANQESSQGNSPGSESSGKSDGSPAQNSTPQNAGASEQPPQSGGAGESAAGGSPTNPGKAEDPGKTGGAASEVGNGNVNDNSLDLSPPPSGKSGDDPDSEGMAETRALLDMLQRGRELHEQDLEDMGWPPQRAIAFLKALERLHQALRSSGSADGAGKLTFDPRVGSSEVQTGRARSAEINTAAGESAAAPDGLRHVTPPREQRVPPELRAILEAYYRSLAEHEKSEKKRGGG